MANGAGRASADPVLFHPDYTVGPGITPDLLTHPAEESLVRMALAGFGMSPIYRRWGIAPRPENASPNLATLAK
jgi:hypothetical protein